MKFILIFSLLSFSNLSFSSQKPSITDVVQAIKYSLASQDLNCFRSGDSLTFKASSLNFSNLVDYKYTMTINEAEQPVITFLQSYNAEECVVTITTNSDLTVVEGIQSVSRTLTKTLKNVGTITNPRFEEKIVKTISGSFVCK